MDYQQPPMPDTDNSFQDVTDEEEEEAFPTVMLDDDIWLEDPVPDGHLCIHEKSQPHFLSLSIQPGPATIHFRKCSSIILQNNGPR